MLLSKHPSREPIGLLAAASAITWVLTRCLFFPPKLQAIGYVDTIIAQVVFLFMQLGLIYWLELRDRVAYVQRCRQDAAAATGSKGAGTGGRDSAAAAAGGSEIDTGDLARSRSS